jgi:hypothetical protein
VFYFEHVKRHHNLTPPAIVNSRDYRAERRQNPMPIDSYWGQWTAAMLVHILKIESNTLEKEIGVKSLVFRREGKTGVFNDCRCHRS